MRFSETSQRLIATDTPGGVWALGLLFMTTGTFVLSIPFFSADWQHFVLWERLAVLAIGLGHFSGGFASTWRPARTRTELDRATGMGFQRVRTIWRREVRSAFALADVRAVEIVRSTDNDNDPMFQLRLWLAGSRTLWLQAQAVYGEPGAARDAARVRHFLGLRPESEARIGHG